MVVQYFAYVNGIARVFEYVFVLCYSVHTLKEDNPFFKKKNLIKDEVGNLSSLTVLTIMTDF